MTDLNQFRRAMQTPDPGLRQLDLATIMRTGARVRRRRRLTVGAGSGLAVLVLLIGGGQLARSLQPDPVPLAPGAPTTSHKPGTVTTRNPPATPSEPTPTGTESREPQAPVDEAVGDVVHTGIRAGATEWVIYVLPVDGAELPDVSIGLKAVRLPRTGAPEGGYRSNETEGSDRAPGFHAGTGAQNIDDVDMPAFGYYVGAAKRITGRVDGRLVVAKAARWSEDSSVTIYWFDLADVPAGAELTSLAAYDGTGRKLPGGNTTVAVG